MSHYKHLSIEERESLYLMKGQGKSIREIARQLGRSPSTISRELHRNKCGRHPYLPSRAQNKYKARRKNCGRKHILRDETSRQLVRHLIEEEHWSPEQIENRLKLEKNPFQISYASIYRGIHAGLFDPKKKYVCKKERFSYKLRRKGKKKKAPGHQNKQGKLSVPHTISERPEGSEQRTEIGHWEADTVAGKRSGDRLLTLVDRKSRFTLARKTDNWTSEAISEVMIQLLQTIPECCRKSITPDRGHEFAAHETVTLAFNGLPFYFADAYSPWQRGTNENTNGLIRELLPKYSDFSLVDDAAVSAFISSLNRRPRKCLGWYSPYEVFFNVLLHLT